MEQAANRPDGITHAEFYQVSLAESEVSLYLQRKLAHLCVRCEADALPDADFCAGHLVAKRASDRQSRKARRAAARRKRKCVDCGRRSKTYRCQACGSKRRGVAIAAPGVVNAEIWRVDPGTTWNRFRGKGRRGRLTQEEEIDEAIRDLGSAQAQIEKTKVELLKLRSVMRAMSKLELQAAKRAAVAPAALGARFADGVVDKYG